MHSTSCVLLCFACIILRESSPTESVSSSGYTLRFSPHEMYSTNCASQIAVHENIPRRIYFANLPRFAGYTDHDIAIIPCCSPLSPADVTTLTTSLRRTTMYVGTCIRICSWSGRSGYGRYGVYGGTWVRYADQHCGSPRLPTYFTVVLPIRKTRQRRTDEH